jgi:hypothetical protein
MHATAASTAATAHAALLKPQKFSTCLASVALQHRFLAESTPHYCKIGTVVDQPLGSGIAAAAYFLTIFSSV